MKQHVLLRKLIEFDARLDEKIFGEGEGAKKKSVEFALFPAIAAGAIGAGAGSALSRKKRLSDGSWVDESGNPTTAPVVAPLAGAAAGVGAVRGHSSIMKGYGGEGGVREAYRNVGRNVAQGAKTSGMGAMQSARTTGMGAVKSAKKAARSAIPYMQDIGGVAKSEAGSAAANILAKLKKLKGAAVKAFGKNPPKHLVEFEARLDRIIFPA